jgi:hypothetical protein
VNCFSVPILPDDLRTVQNFCQKVIPTVKKQYESRGAYKSSDMVGGKLAEIITARFWSPLVGDITYPDFIKYDSIEKDWTHDLTVWLDFFDTLGFGLAVKSQGEKIAQECGLSWTFQAHEPRDTVLDSPGRTHVSLVKLNERLTKAWIYGSPKIVDILDLLRPPKNLNSKKICLYEDDLTDSLRWGDFQTALKKFDRFVGF